MTIHGIELWSVLAFLFLIFPAVAQMFREWAGPPVLSWRHLWAARWTISLLIGGAIYFGHQWFEPVSVMADWPDAIRCKLPLSDVTEQSRVIFYNMGEANGRRPFRDVMRYFLVGGKNVPLDIKARPPAPGNPPHQGYYPQRLWFSMNSENWGKLIDPREYKDPEKFKTLDYVSQQYVIGFEPVPDCDGGPVEKTTIGTIEKAGNAFSFAKKFP